MCTQKGIILFWGEMLMNKILRTLFIRCNGCHKEVNESKLYGSKQFVIDKCRKRYWNYSLTTILRHLNLIAV